MRLNLAESETLSEAASDGLAGQRLDESSYRIVFREDADVFKPDGSLLLRFRKNVLPAPACRAAYENLRTAASTSFNRGLAGGLILEGPTSIDRRPAARTSGTRIQPIRRDGTVSNTTYARNVESGIVGYFDRSARFPFCRMTAFNLSHPERFLASMPYFQAVDRVFAEEVPERYAAQMAVVERTHPDFYIHGTAFTTVTVNKNWQTAVHKDQGDLKAGFGVLTVLQAGHYEGGLFVLPRYRVAVDIRTADVLMVDVHEWHGNTPIVGKPGTYERISCVFYYRENMEHCGSASEELEFAKTRPVGSPILKAKPGPVPS